MSEILMMYVMLILGLGFGAVFARAWPSRVEAMIDKLDRGLTRIEISGDPLGWNLCAVGPWTDWTVEEFYGRTLIEAVEKAVKRMEERTANESVG